MYGTSNYDEEMVAAAQTIIWNTMRAVADAECDEAGEEMDAGDGVIYPHRRSSRLKGTGNDDSRG